MVPSGLLLPSLVLTWLIQVRSAHLLTASFDSYELAPCSNNSGIAGGCSSCPAGYVCANATADYSQYPCLPGFYCPASTTSFSQFPCPAGTYNALSGSVNATACIDCDPGSFCSGIGNAAPTAPCNAGYYCTGRAASATPSLGVTGGPCVAGDLCPAGSSTRRACPSGGYCNGTDGSVSGQCTSGYYCTQGSPTATPAGESTVWGVVGNQCPAGFW